MARKLRGNTTMDMIRAGEANRSANLQALKNPIIGTSTTISQPSQTSTPAINQSYNKMIGGESIGGSGFGGGLPSMGSLEAASMRLADAASRRNIAEKEAESEMSAKSSGYSSLGEMQRDMRSKRLEQESEMKQQKEEQDMIRRGYIKVGGRWVKKLG